MIKLQGVRSGKEFMSLQNDILKQFDISYSGGAVYLNMKDSAPPDAWNNFAWHIASTSSIVKFNETMANELIPYNAIYRYEQGKNGHVKKDYVRFATEADFTMFIMKWS
jgi:hypothetical protein